MLGDFWCGSGWRRVKHVRESDISLFTVSGQVGILFTIEGFLMPMAVGYWLDVVTSELRGVRVAALLAAQISS